MCGGGNDTFFIYLFLYLHIKVLSRTQPKILNRHLCNVPKKNGDI